MNHLIDFLAVLKISIPNLVAKNTLLITIIFLLAGVDGSWYAVNRTDLLLRDEALKQLQMVAPAWL